MIKIHKSLLLVLLVPLVISGCNSGQELTRVGNPTSDVTLADLPEFDISRYDTSSSGFSNPAALATKEATSTGEFSRVGCDSKSLKGQMQDLAVFAEDFLCLYKMAEEHYPDDFSIPEGDFNYYTIETQNGETLLGRVGYFPDGFGDITEEVLVLDECEGETRTAEMRVTTATADEDLTGSGYYILLTELGYLDEGTLDDAISFVLDTRTDVWSMSVSFNHDIDGEEYGSFSFSLDTTNTFNTFIAATHDDDMEGTFDISNNVVFGPWAEIEGFTIGGSAIVNVIQSPNQAQEIGQISGFVFNDSITLPAIRLDFQTEDGSDLPYHAELVALGNPPTSIEEPVIEYNDTWDCSVPEGETAVAIDLTPDEIAQDLESCEAVENEDNELNCAALEDLN